MRRYKSLLLGLMLATAVQTLPAQEKLSNKQYAEKYSQIALRKAKEYGIPASITLAQGILESGSGSSELAVNANNHFGIKCGSSWKGESYLKDDDAKDECFRKYASPEESFNDHSLFLTGSERYSSLFKLSTDDYKGWANGLQTAGYATNPEYADLLIWIIEREKLYKYDQANKAQIQNTDTEKSYENRGPEPAGIRYGKNNGALYVEVLEGETLSSLAVRTGVSEKKILKYNDLTKSVKLTAGSMIYLSSKSSTNKATPSCEVKVGQTMHAISQVYGVKLSSLLKMNPKYRTTQPLTGAVIRLR